MIDFESHGGWYAACSNKTLHQIIAFIKSQRGIQRWLCLRTRDCPIQQLLIKDFWKSAIETEVNELKVQTNWVGITERNLWHLKHSYNAASIFFLKYASRHISPIVFATMVLYVWYGLICRFQFTLNGSFVIAMLTSNVLDARYRSRQSRFHRSVRCILRNSHRYPVEVYRSRIDR